MELKVKSAIEDTNADAIISTLRTNEFFTRKKDLVLGLTRFAKALEAMLGPAEASKFLKMLSSAENATSVTELSDSVSDAPQGTEVQKLVRKALAEFDFGPYLEAEKNYNDVLSKSRRKNFKSFSIEEKQEEFVVRREAVSKVAESLNKKTPNWLKTISSFRPCQASA